jgi:hypothetical protein
MLILSKAVARPNQEPRPAVVCHDFTEHPVAQKAVLRFWSPLFRGGLAVTSQSTQSRGKRRWDVRHLRAHV